MWSARGGLDIDSQTLLSYIVTSQVEGVTFLGGEPFEQAAAAAELAEVTRASGLSVMTFTGFTLEHLSQTGDVATNRLLDATDLLVDGPYDASRPDLIRPWVGSNNQRFNFLTQRYAYLRDSLHTLPDRIEVRVGRGGEIAVNGWAEVDALETLLDGVGSRHDISTTQLFHDHDSRHRGLHGEAKRDGSGGPEASPIRWNGQTSQSERILRPLPNHPDDHRGRLGRLAVSRVQPPGISVTDSATVSDLARSADQSRAT
jgi:anaerobic ribonucleoside-triphosphate reductase activating protein